MNEVSNTTVKSNAVDIDAFAYELVLSKTFEALLKKPELDDDADAAPSASAITEINKTIASGIAQSVSGFGL